MRLALNEDLEEEEEAMMEDEEMEENAAYKVFIQIYTLKCLNGPLKEIKFVFCLQAENGYAEKDRRGSLLTPTGK